MSTTSDSGSYKYSKPEVKEDVSHTPGKWYLAYDPALNDTQFAGLVTNPKAHALTTERETAGNINHKYVPVELAIQADDLLKENQELKAWKESSMKVWGPVLDLFQEHGSELGLKLGGSISEFIYNHFKKQL